MNRYQHLLLIKHYKLKSEMTAMVKSETNALKDHIDSVIKSLEMHFVALHEKEFNATANGLRYKRKRMDDQDEEIAMMKSKVDDIGHEVSDLKHFLKTGTWLDQE